MVALSTIGAMALNMVLGLLIPAVLYLFMKKRFGHDQKAFFTGCGIMFLFAFVLESLLHQVVLGGSLGETLNSNIWLYALYGASMAAIFEETGRLIAFRFILREEHEKNHTALFYGAGHGGFEAFYILFISGVNNLTFAAMINSGNVSALTAGLEGAALAQIEDVISQMLEISWTVFLISPLERLGAVVLHIALSVLVWFAVKEKKYQLYAMALFLHFFMDFAAVTVNELLSGMGMAGTLIVEAVIWVVAAAAALYAKKIWDSSRMAESGQE